MTEKIDLLFKEESQKKAYLEILKGGAKIPSCKACGFLFQFAFPNTEEGMCDYLICFENKLLCECEYHRIITNLYSQHSDGIIDITPYYSC